jgi:hypothetical protein
MNLAAWIAIFAGILIAFLLPLFISTGFFKTEEEKARARRLADAKMNARLLRLNL